MRCPGCVRRTTIVALLTAGVAGCMFPDPLVRRVSNEFQCDEARVNVVERHDIAYSLYDVEACGRRGRYSCIGGGRHGVSGCVHEPDPPAWDPDPALAANLPSSGMTPAGAAPSSGQRRRICGTEEEDCAFKQNGSWQYRRPVASSIGGCGSLCQ